MRVILFAGTISDELERFEVCAWGGQALEGEGAGLDAADYVVPGGEGCGFGGSGGGVELGSGGVGVGGAGEFVFAAKERGANQLRTVCGGRRGG